MESVSNATPLQATPTSPRHPQTNRMVERFSGRALQWPSQRGHPAIPLRKRPWTRSYLEPLGQHLQSPYPTAQLEPLFPRPGIEEVATG